MKRRIISLFTILVMLLSMAPFSVAFAAENTVVLACSDFQHPNGNEQGKVLVSGLLDVISDTGITSADGFLCCGDYDYEYVDTKGGVDALKEVTADFVTGESVYVQGNHDSGIGTNGMSPSGNCDPKSKEYGVFNINEDDYMWNNSNEQRIKATAQNLIEYLNQKLEEGFKKPIFVVSHLPLHYSMRTRNDGDGQHANYIFNVLNAAGAKGLNIIFMYGHDHSNGWDDYLGGAAVYLKKGDKILIAQNSRTNFNQETLNFTYTNPGFIGYYNNHNGADDTLTMTTWEIGESQITVKRYSDEGLHNLKSAGVRNAYKNESGYSPDTTVYSSPQTIALTEVTDKTPIADLVQRPDSDKESGFIYKRVTDAADIKDGGKYLLVYNDNTDYVMTNSVVTKSNSGSSRTGFDLFNYKEFGANEWIDELEQYHWTFTKSGQGWVIGCDDGEIDFQATSTQSATAKLTDTGEIFTIGGSADAFTLTAQNYCLNYNSRGLINGYENNPAAFYIYEYTGISYPNTQELDYDKLFNKAYVINGNWQSSDLSSGKSLEFYFRGKKITESYNSKRHFNSFDTAYNYYLSRDPDILEDLPVFIFAPGTYSSLITVRYNAIILGANAGINPNSEQEWTLKAMAEGVPENSERTDETVFTAGITRSTRTAQKDAKFAYNLETAESAAGKNAEIKLIIDGVKITGSVGISQYDYSKRAYTAGDGLTLDGQAFNYTFHGSRTTVTTLTNSIVDEFSGSGANALFSAHCDSKNKNDVVLQNVRFTNISSSAKFLFNKYFRNLTIDGLYYANNNTSMFGSPASGSSFCGNADTSTALYDQNVEIKNSVFYKNNAKYIISLGNSAAGDGYTKLSANIHDNFFYDAVCINTEGSYWGVFLINSAKSGVDYVVNVTDNIIHQQTTSLITLFNGNVGLQKSKTTLNFNRNKVTGNIDSIYPATSWNSSYYNFINTSLFYDFSDNFHAKTSEDIALRPVWNYPPTTHLASGYDYSTANYYLDYDFNINSSDFSIGSAEGLGDDVVIDTTSVTANCSDLSGTVTPIIKMKSGNVVKIFKDIECTQPVESVNLDEIGRGTTFYIDLTIGNITVVGRLDIVLDSYPDLGSVSEIDTSKFNFPIININTEGGAAVVDKENYVNCGVSISNTDDEYCLEESVAGIRCRGNSTYLYTDKKSYRIKFDKKQNLFGIGKAKSWVLLGNPFDKTMVRNVIAFAIGDQLGLEFTSEYRFVNVYMNGEYRGLYVLCEQTQTGKKRVNVEEDETGKLDTGYLIEMVGDSDDNKYFYMKEVPASELGNGVTANWSATRKAYLKTPELEFCTDEQVAFISDYANRANRAILTQDWDAFNELCDVESFAKYFITNTILNNGDAGYQLFFYKKENGGKMYAGPIWDFDQSSAASTHCGNTYNKWYTGSKHPWFDSFSNWPEFLGLAKSIYFENHEEILGIIDYYTKEFYPENSYDFHANDLRWDSLLASNYRIPEEIAKLTTYPANYAHLLQWFTNRINWLDARYNEVETLPEIVNIPNKNISLEKGENYTVNYSVTPWYADLGKISWSSSLPSVATVENGVITAHKDGTAVIYVTVADTGVFERITVLVCTEHKNKTIYNDTQHYNVCSLCQKETGFENHSLVNACDTDCECGYTRSITHDYKPTFDAENHFDKCTVCGDIINLKPHVFVNACDTDCECGYTRSITHNYQTSYNDTHHYKECTVCFDKIEIAEHQFDNACDTNCDCDFTRTVPHDYKPTFNDSHHYEECSLCHDKIKVSPHQYDSHSDTVCDCGYERSSQHNYQPSYNDTHHYKECTICFDKIEMAPHVFENACDTDCACGYVREVEPHKYDNACDKFCNICQAERPVEPHKYDNDCDVDCNICGDIRTVEPHKYDNACDKFCNVCQAERTVEPHKYDNACDKLCNVCEAERTVEPHKYDNACDKFCNICEEERTVEPHKYDNACDKFCNICQAERTVEPHKYDNACDKDCNVCKAIRTVPAHVYDNACDKDCNVCKAVRTVPAHVYDNACDKDCNVCKAIRTVEPHKYDNAFDAFCNICKSERTPPNTATRSFADVKSNAWYKYYIDYAVAYGLFSGTSDTTFSPNADMTRAQFVQVLANLSGAKLDNSKASGFSDAPAGKWFTGAVKWAVDNGIASGIGNGKFNPTGKIDRQQMCMMLVNYVENYKKTSLKEKVSYKTFADDKDIAGWAKTAVIKCFKAGLVSGTGNNKFSPKVVANRATGATIFTNFHKEYIA